MNHSMINASVSMHALQQKMDLTANNIANVNTTGYKRKEASFQDVLTSVKQQPERFFREGRMTPLGYNHGWGAKMIEAQLNLAQGSLKPTEEPLDMAIEGAGLFEIMTFSLDADNNPVEEVRWTRDGAFEMSYNPNDPDNLYLITKDGHYVLGQDGEPIAIPLNHRIQVSAEGVVTAYNEADVNAEPVIAGQIKLVRVVRPQLLEQLGDNLFRLPSSVTDMNREEILQTVNADNNTVDPILVRQGFLEQSNVVLAEEMTDLIAVQRSFQMNSRAIASADQLMNLANNLRG